MGRPRKDDGDDGQQDLIDVEPENMKVILSKARKYLKLKGACSEANEAAKKALQSLREAIDDAGLKPIDASGVRKFRCGKHIIEMAPQSDKVKIKDAKDGSDDGDDADGSEE